MFAATGNPLFKGRKEPAANLNAFPFTTDSKLFGHVISEGELSNASTSCVSDPPKPQGYPGVSSLYRHFIAEEVIAEEVTTDVDDAPGELNAIWGHMVLTTSTLSTSHDKDSQHTPAQKMDSADKVEKMPGAIINMHTLAKDVDDALMQIVNVDGDDPGAPVTPELHNPGTKTMKKGFRKPGADTMLMTRTGTIKNNHTGISKGRPMRL